MNGAPHVAFLNNSQGVKKVFSNLHLPSNTSAFDISFIANIIFIRYLSGMVKTIHQG